MRLAAVVSGTIGALSLHPALPELISDINLALSTIYSPLNSRIHPTLNAKRLWIALHRGQRLSNLLTGRCCASKHAPLGARPPLSVLPARRRRTADALRPRPSAGKEPAPTAVMAKEPASDCMRGSGPANPFTVGIVAAATEALSALGVG